VHFSSIKCTLLFVVFGATAPHWARTATISSFLDHTQRRTTVGRTPLDKWSGRRRDLYLIAQMLLYYPILILLHVSAVHIGHRQVGHWFTKRVERGEASPYKQHDGWCGQPKHVVVSNKSQIQKIHMVVLTGWLNNTRMLKNSCGLSIWVLNKIFSCINLLAPEFYI
jgi:hypothetical protein